MPYEILCMVNGRMVKTEVTELCDAMASLDLIATGVERPTNLRPCLIGQPKLQGFIGPSYGGERDGRPVIRYEDREVYAALSS